MTDDRVGDFMKRIARIYEVNDLKYSEDEVRLIIEGTLQQERERIANQIDRMPFGDTAASFAIWIREGAP